MVIANHDLGAILVNGDADMQRVSTGRANTFCKRARYFYIAIVKPRGLSQLLSSAVVSQKQPDTCKGMNVTVL